VGVHPRGSSATEAVEWADRAAGGGFEAPIDPEWPILDVARPSRYAASMFDSRHGGRAHMIPLRLSWPLCFRRRAWAGVSRVATPRIGAPCHLPA
jgi:hypothetical protein